LAFSLYFFLAAASVEALSFTSRATTGDIWGGINITQMVLQVQGAISSPTCNATQYCSQLIAEIPNCLKELGSPGCWCGDVDPLHYCAICMSAPQDNTTNPEQTQTAATSHISYHIGCNAYQAFLNGTTTSNSTSSITPSSSSSSSSSASTTPTQAAATSGTKSVSAGAIGGVVVGGLIGLALISATVFLLYRCIQNKHERIVGSMQTTSAFSDPKYPYGTGGTSPVTRYTPPLNLNNQRENAPYDTRILHRHPEL